MGTRKDVGMIWWLDFYLFGNGWGIASPHCDDAFLWLSGRFYHWFGGLGAQLTSFEWFTPKPGTERILAGKRFRVFSVSRCGPRVMVSWALTPAVKEYPEVAALKKHLQEWGHGL